jgi:hypothetical protein
MRAIGMVISGNFNACADRVVPLRSGNTGMSRLKSLVSDWGGLIALMGIMVAGFHHLDTKIDRIGDRVTETMVRLETQDADFREKMAKQDAYFREKMAKQDADFRERMSRQDAEFKAHMIYYHSVAKNG